MSTIDEIVKNNRSNFDFEEPDDGHLERFLTKLEQKQSEPVRPAHKLIKVLKVAALALILLTAGATSWFLLMQSKQVHSAETSELPAELKQVDQYYTQLADQKLLEIDALAKENQVDKTTVDQATNQVTVLRGDQQIAYCPVHEPEQRRKGFSGYYKKLYADGVGTGYDR